MPCVHLPCLYFMTDQIRVSVYVEYDMYAFGLKPSPIPNKTVVTENKK